MRKILLLTTTTFFITFFAKAQITKGSVLLGGNISVSSNKGETSSSTTNYTTKNRGFSFAPSIGKATKENTIWGIGLSYRQSKLKNAGPNITSTSKQESNSYGTSIFYRKYITLGRSFYVFGQANAGYSYNKAEQRFNLTNSVSKGWATGLSIYPGITYAVNKTFHLEIGINELANLSYSNVETVQRNSNGQSTTSKQKGFSFSTNLSNSNPINVGFRFVIAK